MCACHGKCPLPAYAAARFFDKSPEQIRRWNDWPTTGEVAMYPGDRIHVTRSQT